MWLRKVAARFLLQAWFLYEYLKVSFCSSIVFKSVYDAMPYSCGCERGTSAWKLLEV